MVKRAVSRVWLVTVLLLMVVPLPKLTCVLPCTKWVFWPRMTTLKLVSTWPLPGPTAEMTGDKGDPIILKPSESRTVSLVVVSVATVNVLGPREALSEIDS